MSLELIVLLIGCALVMISNSQNRTRQSQPNDRQRLLDESLSKPLSQTPVVVKESKDGRVKGEPQLADLSSLAAATIEPPIMTSKQLFERLSAAGGPNVVVSEERVMEIRRARNLLKPREDLVEPAVEVPYEIVDLGLPPDLINDEHVDVWADEQFADVA